MKNIKHWIPRCADCKIEESICRQEDGKGPTYCPTKYLQNVVKNSLEEYKKPDIHEFALNASVQEGECYVNRGQNNPNVRYSIKPRIQETIEFAHKMNYQLLGIAFCEGLRAEAKIVSDIFKGQGFEVASIMCKAGRTPKEFLGINEEQKVNPDALCTVLVVKDRVTGHNPLAAIQLHQSYFKKLKFQKFNKGGSFIVKEKNKR